MCAELTLWTEGSTRGEPLKCPGSMSVLSTADLMGPYDMDIPWAQVEVLI